MLYYKLKPIISTPVIFGKPRWFSEKKVWDPENEKNVRNQKIDSKNITLII